MFAAFEQGFASRDPLLLTVLVVWPIGLAPALFTWLLPDLLRYSRGGMAWIAAGFALIFTVLLPLQAVNETWSDWYWRIHPWLFGVFFVYAVFGLALCAVGIFDGKRSAIWGFLAVSCLTAAALGDTVIWLDLAKGTPWVPFGFLGFWACLALGYARRYADRPPAPDLREEARRTANNWTRRSRSIPRKLLREGNLHLLPVFYLIALSDLGREGIENSGSFLFADHIYRNEPSGRTPVGRWLDAHILASKPTQAFRRRYLKASEEMELVVRSATESRPIRILAIPCGLPRDLTDMVARLQQDRPDLLPRIEYVGMDIDPNLLERAKEFTKSCPIGNVAFHQGNALLSDEFPRGPFDYVVSTGLGEFLETHQLEIFYRNVHGVLADGGTFFTSATRKERASEALMSIFELVTRYRRTEDLEAVLRRLPWKRLTLVQDNSGLQTFVVGVK